jgi:hypothetical protein
MCCKTITSKIEYLKGDKVMKRYQKAAYIIIGMIIMATLCVTVIPAMAAIVEKQVTVYTGVNVYVDDVKLNPVDANGKSVDVFVYNGTTYLPVRAVAGALGKPAVWDGKTSSVYIGKHNSEVPVANLLDMDCFYDNNSEVAWNIIGVSGITDNIGNKHYKGVCFNRTMYTSGDIVYLLNQKYTNFKGIIALSEGSKSTDYTTVISIYGDDKLLYTSPKMKKGVYPEEFNVDVTGVVQLKIKWSRSDWRDSEVILSGLDFYNYSR